MQKRFHLTLNKLLKSFAPIYDKLFYFPGDKENHLESGTDLSHIEKLNMTSSLGDSISIWYLKTEKPRGRIIHCHGSGYNISSHYPHVSWLTQMGFEVIMFDYPGYGDSTGTPSRDSTVQTAYDVIDKFSSNMRENIPVFVLGQSLGGNIATVALTEERRLSGVCGVILDSMYSSFSELAAVKIQRKYIKRSRFLSKTIAKLVSEINAPIHRAPKLSYPTLILHSRNDGIVPYTESLNFYNSMIHLDVEFWSHLNSGHTDVLQNDLDGYREGIVEWMLSKSRIRDTK